MNLETRVGPASVRVWGLIVNFVANGLLLYGLAGFVADGSRVSSLITGGAVTVLSILVLSTPSRPS